MTPLPSKPRKPRADALRNRERILEQAKIAFTRLGSEISLDDVARQAGVGAGTLYRHFPNRDALLVGVYQAEVEKLAAEQRRLSAALPAAAALRDWMLLFIDYIATKKIIAPVLNSMVANHQQVFVDSGPQILQAINVMVTAAINSGDVRADIDPLDLFLALVGVANVPWSEDWQASARRLVDILLAGSRPEPAAPAAG